jgi:tight adherence protein C
MNSDLLIPVFACSAVALLAYFVSTLMMGRDDGKIRDRLRDGFDGGAGGGGGADDARLSGFRPMLERVGQAAAQPFMPKSREKQSGLRRQLSRAGIYAPQAIRMVTGCKVIFLGAGLVGGYVTGSMFDQMLMGVSFGGLLGYMLPQMWLKARIKANQRALTHGLPDAIDLMVVCVEAGLTLDAAMQRVGQELAIAHPAVSREFGIAHMETRVGLARSESMRNLGVRTGCSSRPTASARASATRCGCTPRRSA